MLASIAGALLAAGLILILRGAFPEKSTLSSRLAEFADGAHVESLSTQSQLDFYALKLLETVKGERLESYESDVLVSGSDLATTAVEKLKSAGVIGGGMVFFAALIGIVSSPLSLLAASSITGAIGYAVPDFKLKKQAPIRRQEFSRTLTAFMTLLSSSISGGGGLSTAIDDAAAMGDGWVFDHIRQTLAEARLDGTSAWVALEQLGQRLGVDALIELSASLTLAGASGARVTETLVSRAQSSRQKELAEARAEAETKSAKLGVPVAMVMGTWVLFTVFPALTSFLSV